jgi:dTDP-4-dehydrorhamnose reductase
MAERDRAIRRARQTLEGRAMNKIAIIGAGGYVGARLIEQSFLNGAPKLVPIVRSWRSQGRLARYGTCTVRGDASEPKSLVPLLRGCSIAINLTMGNNARILGDVQSIHAACQEAGVGTFVHLSSAEVFGRVDSPVPSEDTPPNDRHWMEYARAKIAAERWLRAQQDPRVQVVILRPGLIWGPGSGWLVGPAQAMVDGTAFLINEGRGVCNLIHVDNLIQHFLALSKVQVVGSGCYNVSDAELITWVEFYTAIAREIGQDPGSIHRIQESDYHESIASRLGGLGQLSVALAIKKRMSGATKIRIKQQLKDFLSPPRDKPEPILHQALVTKDLWWLQGTRNKLPTGKFRLTYPSLSLRAFPELMSAAGTWLRHAGFDRADMDR